MSYESVNPYTGELMQSFPEHTDEQMMDALRRADARFRDFGSLADRSALLKRAAALMMERCESLARTATEEMGKRIAESRWEVGLSAKILEYYADNAARFLEPRPLESPLGEAWIEFEPIGVVLGIEPWNFPYYQLTRFVGPNIAAGNTVLMKHAPGVPQCALAFEQIMTDAGASDGAYINLFLTNEQVSRLIEDPRVQGVAVTGSERAGEAIAAQTGKYLKKSILELGGSDAFLVLDDFDPKLAAKHAVQGRMINAGQACGASKRFIVIDSVADEFLSEFIRLLSDYSPGDPADESTTLAPLCSQTALNRIERQLKTAIENGAKVLLGGYRPLGEGAFLMPTVLTDVAPSNPAFHMEFFGPVALFFRAKDEDEALAIANDSPFGLGGSILTNDPARAKRLASRLQTGMVFLNSSVVTAPELPWGGIKRSGYGRELSPLGIEEFVNKKCVIRPAMVGA
jgi:succinate-semialdehyde dehydrogenase / glutarate-semialdehyde dehydrogenase